MTPDAIIKVRFKTTAEGGRQNAVAISGLPLGCPLIVSGEAFDCRFLIDDMTLELGGIYEVPIKFLRPDRALRKLTIGAPVTLWEGKEIAAGEVMHIKSDGGKI